jgi:hypothetical protein
MNPSKNIRRYSSLALAQLAAGNQLKPTIIVLLGDDGRFWVPYTLRDAEYLMSMGYEPAKCFMSKGRFIRPLFSYQFLMISSLVGFDFPLPPTE